MRFETTSRVVEMVNGVAIVVTLIVLIMEVRQTSSMLERQRHWDRATMVNMPYFEDPRLTEILTKVMVTQGHTDLTQQFAEVYGMDEHEAVLWARYMLLQWELTFADWKYVGEADEDLNRRTRLLLRSPDIRLSWILYREVELFRDDFVRFVDTLVDPELEQEWTPECGFERRRCRTDPG